MTKLFVNFYTNKQIGERIMEIWKVLAAPPRESPHKEARKETICSQLRYGWKDEMHFLTFG